MAFLASLFEGFNTPEILQPTHPAIISILLVLTDAATVIAAFCYAFKKRFIANRLFWQRVLAVYFITNFIALYYEYTRPNGYTLHEVFLHANFTVLFVIAFAMPTYFYYSSDLASSDGRTSN